MFKLPDGVPNIRTSAQDWADFAEFHAVKNGRVSLLDLIKRPLLISDETEVAGIEDSTDAYISKSDEISAEIRFRTKVCSGLYPFALADHDYSVVHSPQDANSDLIYRYLLLATRLRMSNERIKGGIDGALLFEELCATVALNFFGPKSQVDIFGTSKTNTGNFETRLENLIKKMGEGGSVKAHPGHRPQDDKVDLVIWKGFSDMYPSQMLAFGQCKTGTSWRDKLTELMTEIFCKTWFTDQPVLTPVRLFFSAQYFPKDNWSVMAYRAGLVFDRFRILDYLPPVIDQELLDRIEAWTNAVSDQYLVSDSST